MATPNDPKRWGRFNISDIRRAVQRARRHKLMKDLGFILLVWLTGAVLWLMWEWTMP